MDYSDRIRRYKKMLHEIDEDFPKFSIFVHNIFLPCFIKIRDIPTAAVSYNKISDSVDYIWDPDFFDGLEDGELIFIVIHEAMHVLFGHHVFMKNEKINPMIFNLAADAVINDMIIDRLEKKMKHIEIKPKEGLIYGMGLIGENCSNRSAMYVYRKLLNEVEKAIMGLSNMFKDILDGITDPEEIKKKIEEILKDLIERSKQSGSHDCWNIIPQDDLEKILSKYGIKMEDLSLEFSKDKQRGTNPGGVEELVRKKEVKFSLSRLIKHIVSKKNEDSNYYDSWRRQNSKLLSVYPDFIIPNSEFFQNKSRPNLLFAVDCSGSISSEILEEFIGIAKHHSQDYNVKVITFDVDVAEFSFENMKVVGRGGTCFENLAKWVNQNIGNELEVCFVLTDGWGGEITETLDSNRWFWIITPGGSAVDERHGKSYFLPKDYNRKK